MRRLRVGLALALAASGCAASRAPASGPPGSDSARAPFDAPPVAHSSVGIRLDLEAARQILIFLARPGYDKRAAAILETVPGVRAAIRESNRPAAVFEHDLAAAFDDRARTAVFDFQRIRENRGRWDDLLKMIAARQAELEQNASARALSLLPAQAAVSVTTPIDLTFGLAGRADLLVVPASEGGNAVIVVDLARALSDVESSPPAEQIKHLSRLIAGEAFRRAWAAYRAVTPAWQTHDAALGQLDPLLRVVAEAGPAGLYSFDENFFPLSVWLKEPMKSSIDEMNQVAERLVSAEGDLDQRVEIAAAIRKPEFAAQVGASSGAFLSDGIIQVLGLDAFRAALAGGPRAFFEAYELASRQKGRELIPLAKAIQDRLAAPQPPRP